MSTEDIIKYCLSKHKAYEDYPFGNIPICYNENDYKITLKCTSDVGQFFRSLYPDKVVRGYHCPPIQQPYWNTVYLSDFPDDELLNMIDLAYNTVLNSFSKKIKRQIIGDT